MAFVKVFLGVMMILMVAYLYANEPAVRRQVEGWMRGDTRISIVESSLSEIKRLIK